MKIGHQTARFDTSYPRIQFFPLKILVANKTFLKICSPCKHNKHLWKKIFLKSRGRRKNDFLKKINTPARSTLRG